MPLTHAFSPVPRRCVRRKETVGTRVRRPEPQCADCAHSQNPQRPWYGGTSEYGTSKGDSRSTRTRTGAGYVARFSSGVHKVIDALIFQTMYRNSRGQSYPVNRSKLRALADASPRVAATMLMMTTIFLALEVRVNLLIMSRPR